MPKTLTAVLVAVGLLAGCGSAPDPAPQATRLPSGHYAERQCGGTRSGWAGHGAESGELMAYNLLAVAPAGISWNSVPIDQSTLASYLDEVRKLSPLPVTALVPAPSADCAAVERARQLMDEKLQCRSAPSYCVEYSESEWAQAHPPVPAPENVAR